MELRENAARIAPLSTLFWEVRGQNDKPLLHFVKHGGAMKVIELTSKVEEVLKITHVSQVFQEFPDEQSLPCAVSPPPRIPRSLKSCYNVDLKFFGLVLAAFSFRACRHRPNPFALVTRKFHQLFNS